MYRRVKAELWNSRYDDHIGLSLSIYIYIPYMKHTYIIIASMIVIQVSTNLGCKNIAKASRATSCPAQGSAKCSLQVGVGNLQGFFLSAFFHLQGVEGLGLRVEGLGFRVEGLGLRV